MAFEYSIIETTTYTVIRESVDGEEGFELKTFDTYDEANEFATILNKEMAASAVAAYPDAPTPPEPMTRFYSLPPGASMSEQGPAPVLNTTVPLTDSQES